MSVLHGGERRARLVECPDLGDMRVEHPIGDQPGKRVEHGGAAVPPYSPSRSLTSPGFTPAARIRTTSSPGPATGSGTSRNASFSGPPGVVNP